MLNLDTQEYIPRIQDFTWCIILCNVGKFFPSLLEIWVILKSFIGLYAFHSSVVTCAVLLICLSNIVRNDFEDFKKLLLEKKKAYVDWYYQNGRVEAQKPWDASRFSKDSNLLANVRSRPEAKNGKWKELGLTKVVYKIEK